MVPRMTLRRVVALATLLLPQSCALLLRQIAAGATPNRECCHTTGRSSGAPHCAFQREELEEGAEWEGTVSKIVDYGCFVRLGTEQHMGLIHISSLSKERIERECLC